MKPVDGHRTIRPPFNINLLDFHVLSNRFARPFYPPKGVAPTSLLVAHKKGAILNPTPQGRPTPSEAKRSN